VSEESRDAERVVNGKRTTYVCKAESVTDEGETVVHEETGRNEQIYPVSVASASCVVETEGSLHEENEMPFVM